MFRLALLRLTLYRDFEYLSIARDLCPIMVIVGALRFLPLGYSVVCVRCFLCTYCSTGGLQVNTVLSYLSRGHLSYYICSIYPGMHLVMCEHGHTICIHALTLNDFFISFFDFHFVIFRSKRIFSVFHFFT